MNLDKFNEMRNKILEEEADVYRDTVKHHEVAKIRVGSRVLMQPNRGSEYEREPEQVYITDVNNGSSHPITASSEKGGKGNRLYSHRCVFKVLDE